MELASVNADQNSFLRTVMSATWDTMITLNVNCVIVIPMELMVTYVKWVVDSVLAKRITEEKTVIDAKKNIMDFQIACVSVQILAYIFLKTQLSNFQKFEDKMQDEVSGLLIDIHRDTGFYMARKKSQFKISTLGCATRTKLRKVILFD